MYFRKIMHTMYPCKPQFSYINVGFGGGGGGGGGWGGGDGGQNYIGIFS